MSMDSKERSSALTVIFVVSRDWQVARNERIVEIIEDSEIPCKFLYVSEELWTLGNAQAAARIFDRPVVLLPRMGNREKPVWLEKKRMANEPELHLELSRKMKQALEEESNVGKLLVFYDGFGPVIDGAPSQLLVQWLSGRDVAFVFLQHGYRRLGSESYLLALKHWMYRKFLSKDSFSTGNQTSNYISFVFDKRSMLVALLFGSSPFRCKVVGNTNALSHVAAHNIQRSFQKQPKHRIQGTVVFSTGSYKNDNYRESRQFELLVRHLTSFPLPKPLFLKPKSGEDKLMSAESRAFYAALGFRILPADFSIQNIGEDSLIVSSCDSNVGLEAIQWNLPLLLLDVQNDAHRQIRTIYRDLGVPVFTIESQSLPRAYATLDFDETRIVSTLDFQTHLHRFILKWWRLNV
jgi:hypothetical protein